MNDQINLHQVVGPVNQDQDDPLSDSKPRRCGKKTDSLAASPYGKIFYFNPDGSLHQNNQSFLCLRFTLALKPVLQEYDPLKNDCAQDQLHKKYQINQIFVVAYQPKSRSICVMQSDGVSGLRDKKFLTMIQNSPLVYIFHHNISDDARKSLTPKNIHPKCVVLNWGDHLGKTFDCTTGVSSRIFQDISPSKVDRHLFDGLFD